MALEAIGDAVVRNATPGSSPEPIGANRAHQPWIALGTLIALAITSQILGQTVMAYAVKFLPLQLAAFFVLLQPVAAAVYAFVLFDESLSLVQMAGIGILLMSIYWAKTILDADST